MGDQLNKAFEAYRQVSIEKENAKKELQQKVMKWGEELVSEMKQILHQSVSCRFLHWKYACSMYVCWQSNIKKYVLCVNQSVPHTDV